jgi:hypothetical protein
VTAWASGPAEIDVLEGTMIEQYRALALQPTMRGCRKRSVAVNIRHISELIDAAVWFSAIDLPVRLICVPDDHILWQGEPSYDMYPHGCNRARGSSITGL